MAVEMRLDRFLNAPRISRSGLLALVIFGLAFSSEAAEPPATDGPCALAPTLRAALQQRFGSSRVLKATDLFEDERGLFKVEHPGACPGLTTGRFFGSKERPAIALVLLDIEPRKNIRLVVARPAMSTWTLVELDEMDAGTTAVVSKDKAGTNGDPHSTTSRESTNEVIVLTSYETWRRVYAWNGRAFEALLRND